MWRNIASDLVDIGYQIIAIDNIHEFGRSYYTKRITQTSKLVDWLDQTLTQLNINNNVELMGFSLGAWLGAQYGLSHFSKIKRLLLISPFMIIYWPRIFEVIPRLALCALPSLFLKRYLCSWLFNNAYRKNSTTKDMVDSWISEFNLGFKCYKLPKPAKFDLISAEQIKTLESKANIMLGLLDRGMYAKKTFEALKDLNYQGQVEMLNDAGHDLSITHSNKIIDFWRHD
jgi:pimeloyl-ACP methyl ester carboxylesterase